MDSKKHILFLMYDGLTDPLGQSQVLPYIIGLTKLGYQFSIISCEKPKSFNTNFDVVKSVCSSHDIHWIPHKYTKFPPIISTILDLRRLYLAITQLNKLAKIEMIHCRSYLPALLAFQLKKILEVKILFDMRGFWADERVDGGLWNLSNPIFNYIYKFFKRKEIEFFSQSDSVISLTENGKSEIHSWESVPNNPIPIEVIPCCVDAEFFDYTKIDQNSIRALKTKIHINKESYILSYLGSIGTWYLLEEMLDFFIVLKKSIPSAIFLFITQDDKKKILGVSRAKGISDEDIFIIKAQRNEVPLLASLSNSSIFFIKPSYSKKASSPTKQGELMALGIPIICNDGVGDTSSIVKKYESGIVIDAFNINNYEKAIEDLVSMKFEKAKIRAGAMDYFSLEKGVEKYANVYSKIFQY